MQIKGNVFIVTGGASGLGEGTARLLSQAGGEVVIADMQDEKGQAIDRTVEGFHALVVQHECDHLIGKLFPMRVRDFTHFGFTEVLFPDISAAEDD